MKRVSEECIRVGPAGAEQPLIVVADLCCDVDVVRLVDATVEKFGRLDILINNAGCGEFATIETTSLELYDRQMNINVRSVYHLTMLCVPHLIAARGNIVNVSSLLGTRSSAKGDAPYAMSKAAVNQMTCCVALELASKGVRVNSVNPGVTVTDFHARSGITGDDYVKFMEHQRETHPLGRVGDPEDTAQAIVFLASTNASFITGEHLHVDGGYHAVCFR